MCSWLFFIVAVIMVWWEFTDQSGGGDDWDDPYKYIRPSIIVDFLRRFWLTR